MAEQEPTVEQLAAIAAENQEEESAVSYKPPAQKTLQEIEELDKDDESLRKYKELLLGNRGQVLGRSSCFCSIEFQLSSYNFIWVIGVLEPVA